MNLLNQDIVCISNALHFLLWCFGLIYCILHLEGEGWHGHSYEVNDINVFHFLASQVIGQVIISIVLVQVYDAKSLILLALYLLKKKWTLENEHKWEIPFKFSVIQTGNGTLTIVLTLCKFLHKNTIQIKGHHHQRINLLSSIQF